MESDRLAGDRPPESPVRLIMKLIWLGGLVLGMQPPAKAAAQDQGVIVRPNAATINTMSLDEAVRASQAAWSRGEHDLTARLDRRIVEVALQPGASLNEAIEVIEHGLLSGRFETVLVNLDRLEPSAAAQGDPRVRSRLAWFRGEAERERGDRVAARGAFLQAQAFWRDARDPDWDQYVRNVLALADLDLRDGDPAAAQIASAEAMAEVARHAPVADRARLRARIIEALSIAYADIGEVKAADQAFLAAQRLRVEIGASTQEDALSVANAMVRRMASQFNDIGGLEALPAGFAAFGASLGPQDVLLQDQGAGVTSYRGRRILAFLLDATATFGMFESKDPQTRQILAGVLLLAQRGGAGRDPQLRLRTARAKAMMQIGSDGLTQMAEVLAQTRSDAGLRDGFRGRMAADLGLLNLWTGNVAAAAQALHDASSLAATQSSAVGTDGAVDLDGFGGVSWFAHIIRGGRRDSLEVTFPLYLEALWKQSQRSDANQGALEVEAFRTLQLAAQTATSGAIAELKARTTPNAALARKARQRQDLNLLRDRQSQAVLDEIISGAPEAMLTAARDLAATRANLARLEAEIRKSSPANAPLQHEAPLSLTAAQALLGPDEALVMLLGGKDIPVSTPLSLQTNGDATFKTVTGVYIAALSRTEFVWRRADTDTLTLSEQVRKLRCQLDAASCGTLTPTPDAFDTRTAFALHQTLLAPLASVLAGKSQLIVVAPGSLSALPLSVLTTAPTPASWRDDDPRALARAPWLMRTYAVSVIPTVSSLEVLRALPTTRRSSAFAGFGDPLADRAGAARVLPRLRWAGAELTQMRDTLGGAPASVRLGEAATEQAVRAADLRHTRVIAFATHGMAAGEWPGNPEPGLVMTAPDAPEAGDDGFLTASEISRLRLGADWILLSACRTASDDGSPSGDSLSGLSRSFFQAGARSVLASYWSVRDDAAALLTTDTILRRQGGRRRAAPRPCANPCWRFRKIRMTPAAPTHRPGCSPSSEIIAREHYATGRITTSENAR